LTVGGGGGDGSSYHDGSRNDHLESTFTATISARSVDTVRIVKPSDRLVVGGNSYNPTTTTTTNAPSKEEKKATATANAVLSDEDMDNDDDDDDDMLVYDHDYDDGDYDGYGEEY